MLYAIVAVIALILDQAVKYWTTANIVLNSGTKDLIPGLIHLTNIHNTGAAFSILEGARWFFVILCVAFVVLIIYVLASNIINTPLARWMAVMVMAGAIGNCIDRVICGYVVDMFEFEFMSFPVFNVADIYITVCGVIFCIAVLLEKPAGEAPAKAAKTEKGESVKMPAVKLPKRQKTEVPNFPKRERPVEEAPAVDPNDPFAEWERLAAKKAASDAQEAPAKPVEPSPAAAAKAEAEAFAQSQAKPTVTYTQPEPPKAEPQPEVKPAPAPEQPKSVAPAAPAAEVKKAVDEFDFDLDSILAEFKDF